MRLIAMLLVMGLFTSMYLGAGQAVEMAAFRRKKPTPKIAPINPLFDELTQTMGLNSFGSME